jgi:hypothetical protein
MERNILEIKALGRPCYLGQLYNARTSSFIPGFSLFKENDIKAREVEVTNTTLKFKEVKGLSDRTSSLGISSELSVSIAGGLVGASGVGSYLNSKHDTSESVTVAVIAQYRTTSKSLDFNDLISKIDMDATKLARTGATHVVTSIVYGGDVVGALTQKSTNKEGNIEMKGKFSSDVLKGMERWFSASAKIELSVEEKEKMNSFDLDLELSADLSLQDEDATPTDPMSLIAVVKKSAKLVGKGVPYVLLLTPLTMLTGDALRFQEFNEADLVDIMDTYDRMLSLENSRAALRSAVEACVELFPTFTGRVRHGFTEVTKLVKGARGELGQYLQCYRSKQDVEEPSDFVVGVKKKVDAEQAEYERDKDEWRTYQDMLAMAERSGFPFIGVRDVKTEMTRVDKGMLVTIIVPEKASWEAVMDLYGGLAVDIRQWRASMDKGTDIKNYNGSQTEFISIFADPFGDATLESLDGETGTVRNALASSRYFPLRLKPHLLNYYIERLNLESFSATAGHKTILVARSGTYPAQRAGELSTNANPGDTSGMFTSPSLTVAAS